MVSKLKCLMIDSQMLVEKWRLQTENVMDLHLILFNLCKSQIAMTSIPWHFLRGTSFFPANPSTNCDNLD